MFAERLGKIKVEGIMYSVANTAAKTRIKAYSFKNTERGWRVVYIHKEEKPQGNYPEYLLKIFHALNLLYSTQM